MTNSTVSGRMTTEMNRFEALARTILWLGKRAWGLSFLLAFVSFWAIGGLGAQQPEGRINTLFEGPVFRLGVYVGAVIFPNYGTRGTNGFYLVPLFGAAADFLVDYHFAVQRHNMTVQTGYPGGYPGVVCGPFRCWEGWGWGPPEVGYEHIRFREGTIVFDLVQRSTKHLVYRAIGEKPVNRKAFSLTQDEIDGLVRHLLKDLKTSRKRAFAKFDLS